MALPRTTELLTHIDSLRQREPEELVPLPLRRCAYLPRLFHTDNAECEMEAYSYQHKVRSTSVSISTPGDCRFREGSERPCC